VPVPQHRDDILSPSGRLDAGLAWITDKVLASRTFFIIALTVPLISLIPDLSWFQRWVIILSSNWIQLWALPALQRSQNLLQAKADAKADVDHANLLEVVANQHQILARLVAPAEGSAETL
jgi:hypothetical protein